MEHTAYDLKKLSTAKAEELQELINDLVEYFEDRMDCDMEDGHYIPNDAMRMIVRLNEVFDIRQC